MKPENQPSPIGSESVLVETMPTVIVPAEQVNDYGVEQGAERYEQAAELTAIVSDVAVSNLPPVQTTTALPIDDKPTQNSQTSGLITPSVASDDDLIEKEWVDRAKKIVVYTHDDPYKREQEVSKLQSDYIKKRYGRELGVSE